MSYLRSLLIIPFLIFISEIKAQVSVNATADTTKILIGEPINLNLSIQYTTEHTIRWPEIPDTFQAFELIEQSNIRRSRQDNSITEQKSVSITSFDTGWHVIEPFYFNYAGRTGTDSVKTEPILIHVSTVAVDTTQAIKPLRGILEVEKSWRDYIIYIVLAVLLIAFLILSWWWYRRRKNRKINIPAPIQEKVPIHVWAHRQIDLLESQYRNGQIDVKTFYISLSGIIRKYIFEITRIDTFEMTTNETINTLKTTSFDKESIQNLYQVLSTADMAKFARSEPAYDTNLEMLSISKKVISLTKEATEEWQDERI